MSESRVLIVFHSSAGNTKKVAEALGTELNAQVEQMREVVPLPVDIHGKGMRNFYHMGRVAFGALRGKRAAIKAVQYDPTTFDLVLVGTPVYAHNVSMPVLTYFDQYCGGLPRVGYFCTGEDPENGYLLEKMAEICGKPAEACSAFHSPKIASGEYRDDVARFVEAISRTAQQA